MSLDIKGIGDLTIAHLLFLGLFAKHRKRLSKTWVHFQLCQSHQTLQTKSSSLPKIPIQNLFFNTLDYKFDFHFFKNMMMIHKLLSIVKYLLQDIGFPLGFICCWNLV